MATECFCGCGRPVPFRWRPVSSRGEQLQETVKEIRKTPGRGRSLADREYMKDAKRACEKLAEVVHEQLPADAELEAETKALLRKHAERYPRPGLRLLSRWQLKRR